VAAVWPRWLSSAAPRPDAFASRADARRAMRATDPRDDAARFLRPPPLPSSSAPAAVPLPASSRSAAMEAALRDRFGRQHTYLRVSLTEKCSLRCTYCMPLEGVPLSPADQALSSDEILAAVAAVAEGGVTRVRLTGGEPLLRRDWPELFAGIASTPGIAEVAVTTNAVALTKRRMEALVASGVTSVNVSLDTLRPERFESLARRPAPAMWRAVEAIRVLSAVAGVTAGAQGAPGWVHELASKGRLRSVKVNAVALRGVTEDEVPALAALAAAYGTEVRFIEAMPFAGNDWEGEGGDPAAAAGAGAGGSSTAGRSSLLAMRDIVRLATPAFPSMRPDEAGLSHGGDGAGFDSHATARVWRLGPPSEEGGPAGPAIPDALGPGPVPGGRVGVIASMTAPFCGGCNRLRLTADGRLKACLFGAHEVPLREPMRAARPGPDGDGRKAAVLAAVADAVGAKHAALGGHATPEAIAEAAALDGRPMILIGG